MVFTDDNVIISGSAVVMANLTKDLFKSVGMLINSSKSVVMNLNGGKLMSKNLTLVYRSIINLVGSSD